MRKALEKHVSALVEKLADSNQRVKSTAMHVLMLFAQVSKLSPPCAA
jgi:hypothetical protein